MLGRLGLIWVHIGKRQRMSWTSQVSCKGFGFPSPCALPHLFPCQSSVVGANSCSLFSACPSPRTSSGNSFFSLLLQSISLSTPLSSASLLCVLSSLPVLPPSHWCVGFRKPCPVLPAALPSFLSSSRKKLASSLPYPVGSLVCNH